MIGGFRHKGLRALFEHDDRSRLPAARISRLRLILAALEAADHAEDINVHSFKLHKLRGDMATYWAVTVRANWRVTFRFENGRAVDIDLVDYH